MDASGMVRPPSLDELLAAPAGARPAGGGVSRPVRMVAPERGLQIGFESSLQAPDALLSELAGLSGRKISRSAALRVPAVLRARNLIAGVPATLPIELRDRGTRELDGRPWLGEDPDPALEASVVYALTFEDLLFHQTSYWRVTRRHSDGFPAAAEHVDHRAVAQHAILGMPSQVISEDLQFTTGDPVLIDGEPTNRRDVIRFVGPNPPLLVHGAKAIRTAAVLSETAERYANDPLPLGYFEDSDDQTDPLDDDEIQGVLNQWETARRERVWGYVSKGLKLSQLEPPTPEQLQLAESRNGAVLEIARLTGLDPEDVGVHTTSRTYQNSQQRRQDLIDMVLINYIVAVQQRLSKPDISPRHLEARFDVSAFLRAATRERFAAHQIAIRAGFRTADEVRRDEGWPDLPRPARAPARRPAPQPAGRDGPDGPPAETSRLPAGWGVVLPRDLHMFDGDPGGNNGHREPAGAGA